MSIFPSSPVLNFFLNQIWKLQVKKSYKILVIFFFLWESIETWVVSIRPKFLRNFIFWYCLILKSETVIVYLYEYEVYY